MSQSPQQRMICSHEADPTSWRPRAGGRGSPRSRSAGLGLGLALLSACDGGESVTDPPPPPNRPPAVVSAIEAVTVEAGGTLVVDASGHFADPDGDALEYAASSSGPGVASASAAGAEVTVAGVSPGTAEVTVTARDAGGLAASQPFTVTVPNRAPAVVSAIAAVTVEAGGALVVDASGHFVDPDGDALEYAVSSSRPGNTLGRHRATIVFPAPRGPVSSMW